MKTELKNRIMRHTENQVPTLLKYIKNIYDVDLSTINDFLRFAREHKESHLPDKLFQSNKKNKNVSISIHDSIFNGLLHYHDFFELIYVSEGNIVEEVDGIQLCLPEGSICIHNPNALHKIVKCDPTDCLINIAIKKETFENEVFLPVFHEKSLNHFFLKFTTMKKGPNFMDFPYKSEQVDAILNLLITEFLDPQSNERLVSSLVFVLFGVLLREYQPDEFSDELLTYLTDHLSDATLRGCASHFNYHEKYFSERVKRRLGKSFIKLLTEMRMRRATDLLNYTSDSVADISFQLGYQNPSVFYKNFKRYLKMTPSNYRHSRKRVPHIT